MVKEKTNLFLHQSRVQKWSLVQLSNQVDKDNLAENSHLILSGSKIFLTKQQIQTEYILILCKEHNSQPVKSSNHGVLIHPISVFSLTLLLLFFVLCCCQLMVPVQHLEQHLSIAFFSITRISCSFDVIHIMPLRM